MEVEGTMLTINNSSNMLSMQRVTETRLTSNLSSQRLSGASGLGIPSESNHAAALSISDSSRLRFQTATTFDGERSRNDAISILQTVGVSTDQLTDILQRMKLLAYQSADVGISNDTRANKSMEFFALREEMDLIAKNKFADGKSLLDGNYNKTLKLSTFEEEVSLSFADMTKKGLDLESTDLFSPEASFKAIEQINEALKKVRTAQQDSAKQMMQIRANDEMFENRRAEMLNFKPIRDADIAHESAELSKLQILNQAGASVLAQARQNSAASLRLLG
jgi:flagellin